MTDIVSNLYICMYVCMYLHICDLLYMYIEPYIKNTAKTDSHQYMCVPSSSLRWESREAWRPERRRRSASTCAWIPRPRTPGRPSCWSCCGKGSRRCQSCGPWNLHHIKVHANLLYKLKNYQNWAARFCIRNEIQWYNTVMYRRRNQYASIRRHTMNWFQLYKTII